jgi:hypothetical protein
MTTTTKIRAALALLAASVLTACGGGGDEPPVTAAGVYRGSSDTGRELTSVVLSDGNYYMLYSGAAPGSVGGGIQGAGTLADFTFASSTGRNYNLEGFGTQAATLSSSVSPSFGFRGTVDSGVAGRMSFDTQPTADSGATASLATLAGAYPGQVTFALGVRPAVFTVTEGGQVSSSINSCLIGGSVSPRTDVNAYDLTIVFGGAPCVFPNWSFSGVAYYDAAAGRLTAFVRNPVAQQAIFFTGSRS